MVSIDEGSFYHYYQISDLESLEITGNWEVILHKNFFKKIVQIDQSYYSKIEKRSELMILLKY